jgi:phosphoribosylformimino-5-aminoimidazole carboxamide ribotide isomerase
MDLYPAIDIFGGRAVRLEQGDFERRREYADDPLDAARAWVQAGARFLHVVDLDGAREGGPVNLGHLRRISSELGDRVELIQFGGGLRSAEDAAIALAAGANRIVIGTAAFTNPALLDRLLADHSDRVAVGVDVRAGRVAVRGWRESTELAPAAAIATLVETGVQTIVYTSVDRDGTLAGIDAEEVGAAVAAASGRRVIYSGGIGSLEDLRTLVGLALPTLEGAIAGKALYEGRFTIAEALAELGSEPARAQEGRD